MVIGHNYHIGLLSVTTVASKYAAYSFGSSSKSWPFLFHGLS